MPLFAMTAVVFLLILFLVVDIGQVRIAQGDLYKSLDAGALAGANQSTHHELYDYEQVIDQIPVYKDYPVYNYECTDLPNGEQDCVRVPPFTETRFAGYRYVTHEPEEVLFDEWVQIEQDQAVPLAEKVFWKNAYDNGLNMGGKEVVSVKANLKDIDVLEMRGEVRSRYQYLPSLLRGLFGKDTPTEVTFHKASEAQAVLYR